MDAYTIDFFSTTYWKTQRVPLKDSPDNINIDYNTAFLSLPSIETLMLIRILRVCYFIVYNVVEGARRCVLNISKE